MKRRRRELILPTETELAMDQAQSLLAQLNELNTTTALLLSELAATIVPDKKGRFL